MIPGQILNIPHRFYFPRQVLRITLGKPPEYPLIVLISILRQLNKQTMKLISYREPSVSLRFTLECNKVNNIIIKVNIRPCYFENFSSSLARHSIESDSWFEMATLNVVQKYPHIEYPKNWIVV